MILVRTALRTHCISTCSCLTGMILSQCKNRFFIFLTLKKKNNNLFWTKTLNFDQFIPGECHAGPYCRFCFSPLITSSSQKCILFFKAKVFSLISYLLVSFQSTMKINFQTLKIHHCSFCNILYCGVHSRKCVFGTSKTNMLVTAK